MASPRTSEIDDDPIASGHADSRPHESGTRRILRDSVITQPSFTPADLHEDPWASEAPQSLLSVASWLVDSVRRVPESKPAPPAAPSITIADADLTADELAAIDAEWTADQPPQPDAEVDSDLEVEVEVDLEQVELSADEAEAIDEHDLAPLRQSFERGDHIALLAAAEALLEARPTMRAAQPYLAAAREALRRRYMTELGGQREVPQLLVPQNDGAPPRLRADEAFMLGLIDGQATLEEIVDSSELPQIAALQLMDRLVALGLVGCGPRHARYC